MTHSSKRKTLIYVRHVFDLPAQLAAPKMAVITKYWNLQITKAATFQTRISRYLNYFYANELRNTFNFFCVICNFLIFSPKGAN